MKHVSLALLATLALVGVTACQDAVTSPQLDATIRNGRSSFPPPPPEDQTATGTFVATSTLTERSTGFRFSIQQSSGLGPALDVSPSVACPFSIPARFFYNSKENNGWVHFESSDNGVVASSNGMVTYKNGDFSGKGTLEILVEGCGLVVIDLSSVNDGTSFFCGFDQDCWHLFFTDAKLYPCGNTTDCSPIDGSADMEGGVFED